MSDRVVPGPVQDSCGIREAVCIHTKKIYDSCRDKDCIEDLRVYPTRSSQAVIDRALSVRSGRAELLHAYIDVEPANYNRGFYSVDIRYYYRITAEAFLGGGRPAEPIRRTGARHRDAERGRRGRYGARFAGGGGADHHLYRLSGAAADDPQYV